MPLEPAVPLCEFVEHPVPLRQWHAHNAMRLWLPAGLSACFLTVLLNRLHLAMPCWMMSWPCSCLTTLSRRLLVSARHIADPQPASGQSCSAHPTSWQMQCSARLLTGMQGAECPADTSPFCEILLDYLMALKLPQPHRQKAIAVCNAHDFSSASAFLVPSCPGHHTGAAIHRYGHMAARAILSKTLLPSRFVAAPVLAQCSSLGSLTPKWVHEEFCVSLASGRRTDGSLNQIMGMFSPCECPSCPS